MMTNMAAHDFEQELLQQAMAGDRHALEALARQWWSSIRRWAYLETRDREQAEDACQEALLRMVRFLPKYDTGRPFQTWLRTIVRNCCRDTMRKQSRHAHVELREVPQTIPIERTLDVKKHASRALTAWRGLPTRQREIIDLCDIQGHTSSEAANLLGLSPGAIRAQLHAARRALRTQLGSSEMQDLLRDS